MSSKDLADHQDGNKPQKDGESASKSWFSFNEDFDLYLNELSRPADGKNVVVSSQLFTFRDLQEKAAADGHTLRNLPLSRLRSSFHNGFFCLKSENMARVDSFMTLKDYQEHEKEAKGKGESRQFMKVFWTRSHLGDLNKTLKEVPETGKLPKDNNKPTKPDTSFADYKSALTTEQSIKMEKPKETYSLYGVSRDEWSDVIEGNQLLYAFQVNEGLVESLQGQSLQDFLAVQAGKMPAPNGSSQKKPEDGKPEDGKPEEVKSKDGNSEDVKTKDVKSKDGNSEDVKTKDVKPEEVKSKDGNSEDSKPGDGKYTPPVDPKSPSGPNVSTMSTINPVIPISRSTRPVFVINPHSTNGVNGKNEHASDGLFWSTPNLLSTTKIIQVEHTIQQWSLQSGMSSDSFNAGLSFPIGKATIGTKFGFEREQSNKTDHKNKEDGRALTALHLISTAQININETTVVLSPDAEADIKRLRKKRRFADLLSFLMKYGTQMYQTITLGGQLFHAQSLDTTDYQLEKEQTKRMKTSVNASLGIPDFAEVTTGYSRERSDTNVEGKREVQAIENLSWEGLGGNPTLIVDPPRWRESLNDYSSWRPIRFETPVRIDTFIGRLQGYSDVPILFSEIMSTGVLNRSIVALPPTGLQMSDKSSTYAEKTKSKNEAHTSPSQRQGPKPGIIINAKDGTAAPASAPLSKLQTVQGEVTPGGYSWAVFTDERGVQQEIRAELQSTLNLMVNIRYYTHYLEYLRADEDSLSVVLKWTSSSVRDSWRIDADRDAKDSKDVLSKFKGSEEALKTAIEKKDDGTTQWHKDLVELEKDKSHWAAWKKNGTPEEKSNAEKQEKALEAAQAKRNKDEGDQKMAIDKLSQEVAASQALGILPLAQADSNQFLLRNVTSQAWIVGLWTIRRKTSNSEGSLAEDFKDLKSTISNHFSSPQGIEGGCDYITDTLRSQGSDIEADFRMFASDGVARDEIEVHARTDPKFAFRFIDRRISLSSINYLAVTGEIMSLGGARLPSQGYTPEPILLQYQEALAGLLFLQTQGRDVKDLKARLKNTEQEDGEEAQKVLTPLFKKIYQLEVGGV